MVLLVISKYGGHVTKAKKKTIFTNLFFFFANRVRDIMVHTRLNNSIDHFQMKLDKFRNYGNKIEIKMAFLETKMEFDENSDIMLKIRN